MASQEQKLLLLLCRLPSERMARVIGASRYDRLISAWKGFGFTPIRGSIDRLGRAFQLLVTEGAKSVLRGRVVLRPLPIQASGQASHYGSKVPVTH